MARAELKLNLEAIEKMAERFSDPNLQTQLRNVAANDGITALVIQAIRDNFDQEGPGWKALQAETIRRSVSKKLKKQLAKMTDEQILEYERTSRLKDAETTPNRQILRRTSLLFQTVTTAGFSGSSVDNKRALSDDKRAKLKKAQTGKTAAGQNIRRIEGSNLIWGTNLIYAGVQNNGGGRSKLTARPFLVIRDQWEKRIMDFAAAEMDRLINLFTEGP